MLDDLIELSASYCTEIRKMQERPLPQSDVCSPFENISAIRPSFGRYITRSGSTDGNMRHTSGPAYPSTGGYADLRADSRMDPRAYTRTDPRGPREDPVIAPREDPRTYRNEPIRGARMDPRTNPDMNFRATGSNMYPSRGAMLSYPSGMSLPIDVSMQGISDDPRSYGYALSTPRLQSGIGSAFQSSRIPPFQSDRLGSFRLAGTVPSVYPPQGPSQMRDDGQAQSLREERRPPAEPDLDPRDPRDASNNYTDLTGRTNQEEEREITERGRPVLDATQSRTPNGLGETSVSGPVRERGHHRTSAPILRSNAYEPRSSMEKPHADSDQVTEWLGMVSQVNVFTTPMFPCSHIRHDKPSHPLGRPATPTHLPGAITVIPSIFLLSPISLPPSIHKINPSQGAS